MSLDKMNIFEELSDEELCNIVGGVKLKFIESYEVLE